MTREELEGKARETANSFQKRPPTPRYVKNAGRYTGFMEASDLLLPILESTAKQLESNRIIALINQWAAENCAREINKLKEQLTSLRDTRID